MIFITTDSAGVLRYDFDLIDGFTGASAYGEQWTPLETNTVNSVTIIDTIQWFGTPFGAFKHYGNSTKLNWDIYNADSGLISLNVRAIEIDNDGNIWFGTDKGLSIKTESGWFQYPGGIQASGLTFMSGIDTAMITWINGNGIAEGTGLIHSVVNDIKKDFSGKIWVATDGGIEYFTEVPTDYGNCIYQAR
jgi:ligand-binding sensor domain-containing protein